MCSVEDCQISVMSVKNIKYHRRLFYFFNVGPGKIQREILHCMCKGHTQSPSLVFRQICNFKMSNAVLGMFL